jgi:predicted nucleotidyltransferase
VKTVATMTRANLAALVQEKLRDKGIDMVLSGGACVSIYTEGKYASMDLDMIHTSLIAPKRKSLRDAMKELGFSEDGRYFKHADTDLFVEFPAGPPAVGEEPVKEIHERHEETGVLKIISPTDCVKDRLTWLYHDNDLQCLEQAVLVAQQHPISIEEVKRWSKGEGKLKQFNEVRSRLEKK